MHANRIPVTLVQQSDDPVVNEVFDRIAKGAVGIVNIHRTLANSPDMFAAFIGLAHALRHKTGLDPAERELAILRALHRHHGDYEIGHHRRLGAAAGLGEADMDIACSNAAPDGLSDRRRAVVAFADAFATGRGVEPDLATSVREVLSNRGVVELAVTLALYVGLAHLTATLDVPVD